MSYLSRISISSPPKSSLYALLPKLIVPLYEPPLRQAFLKQSGEQSLRA
jgi:hypothetical protein